MTALGGSARIPDAGQVRPEPYLNSIRVDAVSAAPGMRMLIGTPWQPLGDSRDVHHALGNLEELRSTRAPDQFIASADCDHDFDHLSWVNRPYRNCRSGLLVGALWLWDEDGVVTASSHEDHALVEAVIPCAWFTTGIAETNLAALRAQPVVCRLFLPEVGGWSVRRR